jgi:predicted Zn-ribbon and HTH transcriptional regulator
MNGVIERAIENWLTKTNERNYQAAFCQVLMHQGHRVLFSSSHGPMEQGKDIITIAPDGECCAYQTKTGDISLAEWRNISGEIQELVELPVDYPGVDKSRIHRAYLVANGSIKDPVRVQITDRNEDNERKNRQYAHLEVIGQDSLLKSLSMLRDTSSPASCRTCAPFLNCIWMKAGGRCPKANFLPS